MTKSWDDIKRDADALGISPEFIDMDPDKEISDILTWADAKVEEYPDETLKKKYGPSFTMNWRFGFINLRVDTMDQARKAAAIFIYLWTRRVDPGMAERLATAYQHIYNTQRRQG
jgi:hypothetical protein